MLNLRLYERVVYRGRVLTVCGFTPHSVEPPRVWLTDHQKGSDPVEVEGANEIAALRPVAKSDLDGLSAVA